MKFSVETLVISSVPLFPRETKLMRKPETSLQDQCFVDSSFDHSICRLLFRDPGIQTSESKMCCFYSNLSSLPELGVRLCGRTVTSTTVCNIFVFWHLVLYFASLQSKQTMVSADGLSQCLP